MPKTPPIYGLDFLTTSTRGLIDPQCDQIVAIALATSSGTELYDGQEAELLDLVDRRLGLLPTGVLATWFGSLIGFPLLRQRSERLGVTLQLNLADDKRSKASDPSANLDHPQLANWRGHRHLDLRRAHSGGNRRRVTGRGSDPALVPDDTELTNQDPENNALLIRQMTERRWPQCRKLVDRVPAASNPIGDQQHRPSPSAQSQEITFQQRILINL